MVSINTPRVAVIWRHVLNEVVFLSEIDPSFGWRHANVFTLAKNDLRRCGICSERATPGVIQSGLGPIGWYALRDTYLTWLGDKRGASYYSERTAEACVDLHNVEHLRQWSDGFALRFMGK